MKKILAVALMLVSTATFAQHHGYHNHYYNNYYRGSNWGPILGGAIAGAVIYDIYNRPVIQTVPQVIVQQPSVYAQPFQQCTPWIEQQNIDGTITRTRTCNQ